MVADNISKGLTMLNGFLIIKDRRNEQSLEWEVTGTSVVGSFIKKVLSKTFLRTK